MIHDPEKAVKSNSFEEKFFNILYKTKNPKVKTLGFFCGRQGIRTPDPLGVNQML